MNDAAGWGEPHAQTLFCFLIVRASTERRSLLTVTMGDQGWGVCVGAAATETCYTLNIRRSKKKKRVKKGGTCL